MFDLRRASMRNVWIIAHREYSERIRTRGFLMTTVMIPVIVGAFLIGTAFLGAKASKDIHIGVIAADARLAADLQAEFQRQQEAARAAAGDKAKSSSAVTIRRVEAGLDPKEVAQSQMRSGTLDAYLLETPAERPGARPRFAFRSNAAAAGLKAMLADSLGKVLVRQGLDQHGWSAAEARALLEPVKIETVSEGSRKDALAQQVSVSILFFVMYLVIMLYGMNVARSIIEEKTSRIFEVMLATIRPEALMAGKILGVGSVGLTQVGIWLTMLLLAGSSSLGPRVGGETLHLALSGAQMVYFLVYFALGYLLYSAIAAALGAVTNSEQELQQMNMFLMLPLLSCFVLLGTMLAAPDGTPARVLALIPLFTPLLMYFRVSLGHPEAWEIVLSLLLTSGTICGVIWLSSRIYRIGVLMYGKRPNVAEIRRWISYS